MKTKASELLAKVQGKEDLFEMSNISPRNSGLKYTLWFSGDPGTKHNRLRFKVLLDGKRYPMALNGQWFVAPPKAVMPSAEELKQIHQYVQLNKDVITQYWNGIIDTAEFIQGLKKL